MSISAGSSKLSVAVTADGIAGGEDAAAAAAAVAVADDVLALISKEGRSVLAMRDGGVGSTALLLDADGADAADAEADAGTGAKDKIKG